MASLLDEWATIRASDTGDPAARALSPGGGGADALLLQGAGGIGFAPSDDSDEGGDAFAVAAFLGMPPQPAEPDIFALDPVEREVTR